MVNSRNKGANYERQVAQELFLQLGITFRRDLDQYRYGGHSDLIPDNPHFPFCLELKRYADGPIGGRPDWWAQVDISAEREGKWPCLIYKYDRKPDRVVIPLASILDGGEGEVETDLQTFCFIVRELMA